jgi:hypothetical protein
VGAVHFKLCVDSSLDDRHMPRSHTCFFALDLPRYTREDILREKLLYAARYCSAIDNDTSASGQLFDDEPFEASGADASASDALIPFESREVAAKSAPADGGHKPFLRPGVQARASKDNGAVTKGKAPCTVLGAVSRFGEWDTAPGRYCVRWADTDEEVVIAGDALEDAQ